MREHGQSFNERERCIENHVMGCRESKPNRGMSK